MQVDGGDYLTAVVRDWGSHRVQTLGEFFAYPREAVELDLAKAIAEGTRIRDRFRGEADPRLGEVALDLRRIHVGEEDLPGGDGVHRHPRPGPIADLHLVGRIDLVDVV